MNPSPRVGLIGLDTSHAVAFTQLLNDPQQPNHVAGGRVAVAYPGGSADMDLSHSRVPGYTKELQEKWGVSIADSPEAVAQACDFVFIMSIDGRVHREHLARTLPYRRPTFVDKPMAITSEDAAAMFTMAREAGVPLMSSSALRYAGNLTALLADAQLGDVVGCDTFGPLTELPQPPGLFWYGIHTAEILFAVMGTGCAEVRVTRNADGDLMNAIWSDGRMACLHGLRNGHHQFGVTLHRREGFQQANLSNNPRPLYHGLLQAIMHSLPQGKSAIADQETLQVIRFLEAGNESRQTGKAVRL